jgi:hypothetical protein
MLTAIAIDPACADGVHPERLRKLAREGARFTAQHLRALSPLRRRATLVATVLTITRLTDDTVALFDRALGRILRRAEIREQDVLIRASRAINDKVGCYLADPSQTEAGRWGGLCHGPSREAIEDSRLDAVARVR